MANQSPDVVECLTRIPLAARERLLQLPPTSAGHCDAYAAVPAFGQLELRPTGQPYPDTRAVRIAAWKLERCLYPDAAARLLQHNGVDIALLTEMDIGMLRTGQVHTIGQVAERLGHGYCYGLEFLELNAMEPPVAMPGAVTTTPKACTATASCRRGRCSIRSPFASTRRPTGSRPQQSNAESASGWPWP